MFLKLLCNRPSNIFALLVVILLVGSAIFAPWLAPFDPTEQFFDGLTIEGAPLPPNSRFLLGTDLLRSRPLI